MTAYYNDNEPYVAQWLRNLIAEGLIAPGDVDERSIRDVSPDDLKPYAQCHFFAGIGGWSYALRLAGWPDERPVWTGSCPCQPFSVAGRRGGFDDDRHLWPEFRRLIAERRPPTILGEQVAGAADWLRLVRGDLEAMDYAVGCLPIEAASADAEHRRDRYWFVADDQRTRDDGRRLPRSGEGTSATSIGSSGKPTGSGNGVLADLNESRLSIGPIDKNRKRNIRDERTSAPSYGNGNHVDEGWTEHELRGRGFTAAVAGVGDRQFIQCPDGKWRRLPPPRIRWLAHGIPARVDKLRALGNAIDPRPAAAFVAAFMDCRP